VGLALTGIVADAPRGLAKSHGPKRAEITEIIVHATGGPFCQAGAVAFSPGGTIDGIRRFFEANGVVSIHYIIGQDGAVARSVPEDEVAYHAVGHNQNSIGIELINAGDGRESFPQVQIAALARVIAGIRQRYRIPMWEVKGHSDVDHSMFACGGKEVRRKQDPGPAFPWDQFRLQVLFAEK
jgi:N-acetyl-anhydromuramyl-L-alanine amidase AmpD